DPIPIEDRPSKKFDETNVFDLFPLAANDEQIDILQKLKRKRGVLVQGPPGTGKSHTIANLISHLLATGKRILVTSETARALKVLKDKIPEGIKPLCVSLLGADRSSFNELESSITQISDKYADWGNGNQQSIKTLAAKLEQEKRARAKKELKLRQLRESEVHAITIAEGHYQGTAAQLAQRVRDEEDRFDWLTLEEKSPSNPPLANTEALVYLDLERRFRPALREELARPCVTPEQIPPQDQFADLVTSEKLALTKAAEFGDAQNDQTFDLLTKLTAEQCSELREGLATFVDLKSSLSNRPEIWLADAMSDCLSERESRWRVLQEKTREHLIEIKTNQASVKDVIISLAPTIGESQTLADTQFLIEFLSAGGKWTRLGFRTKEARNHRYFQDEIRVTGRAATDLASLGLLEKHLKRNRRLDELWEMWGEVGSKRSKTIATQIADLEENLEALDFVFVLLEQVRTLGEMLHSCLPGTSMPDWSSARPQMLLRVIDASQASQKAKEAQKTAEAKIQALRDVASHHDSHPVVQELLQAFEARDIETWSISFDKLGLLVEQRQLILKHEQLRKRLLATASSLTESIESDSQNPQWAQRLASLEEAWYWAHAQKWVREKNDPHLYDLVSLQLAELEKKISESKAELCSERAWNLFLNRLTPKQSENLNAWRIAVVKMGSGKGKRAARFRREAQQYLTGCVDAIPAWIMPLYRVTDVLPIKPDMYDAVIVDEASQTGIEGLFLFFLARKIIVVGDDQQISPAGVGVSEDHIGELQRRFLLNHGIPFAANLGPTSSLYEQAGIRFTGKTILREHFRCKPEIIQFSNNLCYAPRGASLIPLRPLTDKSLKPIEHRHITTGHQEGVASAAINRPEAEALVAQVVECCSDPKYETKSFGIISLLGNSQSQLIHKMLVQELGPMEMEKRHIICGNAYAFQGDERDVMLLSMVSAPNARQGVLSKTSDQQRFNVAMSRAKDQVWLFHSILPEDLSQKCLRRILLEYVLNPEVGAEQTGEPESQFEQDVIDRILQRGYRIRTQVPAGDQNKRKYRIDIVVEGMNGRLAVECDGDQWHGPEQYEYDVARQRQLERAGWMFHRIRASTFYFDPDEALKSLWKKLETLEIFPDRASHNHFIASPPLPVAQKNEGELTSVNKRVNEVDQNQTLDNPAKESRPNPLHDYNIDEDDLSFEAECSGCKQSPLLRRSTSEPREAAPEPEPEPEHQEQDQGQNDITASVNNIPAAVWLALSRWAKKKDIFESWQRGILYSVGDRLRKGTTATDKQAAQAFPCYKEALALGFEAEKELKR
ncbi:MAG: AAA family ATPase, partial [Deltaproteobacteria bacterium]|nr:AAA family ATPase [Deltaproteobacteria bacterium]